MCAARLLSREELCYTLDPNSLNFNTTEEVEALTGMIGQDRAVRAMEFGLRVNSPGYNIYMAGPAGTGKTTYAANVTGELAADRPVPQDWVYLYDFETPDQPQAVTLPPGDGRRLRMAMEELVSDLVAEIPKAFESDQYDEQRKSIVRDFQQQSQKLFNDVEKQARTHGFTLKRTSTGFATIPLGPDGEPMDGEAFNRLPQEARNEIEGRSRQVQALVAEAVRKVGNAEKEVREKLRALEKEVALFTIDPLIRRVAEAFVGQAAVGDYLERVKEDIVSHLDLFKGEQEENPAAALLGGRKPSVGEALKRYEVTCLVDYAGAEGAPVVVEANPTYHNLIGMVEYIGSMGSLTTDHTMIKPGALHRANGGYLILQVRDVLTNPGAWEGLKRSLKTGKITIEPLGEQIRVMPTRTLRPEPIALSVKVVLIGNAHLYHLLQAYEEDFRKLFKIKADFDVEMIRNEEHVSGYAAFISSLCNRENLRHFDRTGVARVIEYSSRLADERGKVSTRFSEVVEILYEANAWADLNGSDYVTGKHVGRAIEEKIYRSNRIEEKVQESIEQGRILVDTDGSVVGQVNGLAVLGIGDYSFGKPSRITAQTFMGEKGVINIEREAELSGRIHDKGMLILAGYLGGKYAHNKPLSVSASLTFEQLYQGVDGDSASSAELYALLSALADLPLKQGIGVTGSINQKGQIQPIGGVNEKIEGFFYSCKARGLTGNQGVAIPVQNVDNLMLKEEVLEAVDAGRFHIWSLTTQDEGLELLTDVPAGEAGPDGCYPDESVHGRVDRRLTELAEGLQEFQRPAEDAPGESAPARPGDGGEEQG
ncbi:MAG: ATP-binding protein [Thermaerobacterales bacterium]